MSSGRRTTLRDIRLASAASLLSTTALSSQYAVARKSASTSRTFTSAPKHTLSLSDGRTVRSEWSSKTDAILAKIDKAKKETKKVRKKKKWLERKKEWDNKTSQFEPRVRQQTQSPWAYLPDLVLEEIFKMLPYESLLNAGLVCRLWSRILYRNTIWSILDIYDDTLRNAGLCRYVFNMYARDDEDVLDSVKASNALNRIGRKLRHISFLPQQNLHNICQFMRMLKKFCEFHGDLPGIESFRYVFPCDFARKSNEVDIYGTGGMVLQDMKDLLAHLRGLKRLELIDLQLDGSDAAHVLDEVSSVCGQLIHNLSVVNTSRRPFSLLAVATFVNLRCLIISPHNLSDDLVCCLMDMSRLRNLIIITNAYTECVAAPVDYRVWKGCRKKSPKLRVHLVTEGKHSKEITFQSTAPVKSIVYDTPYTKASTFSINLAVELYKTDLECYAHKGLPKFRMSRSFGDRPDSAYLYLVRECVYIHTLMIREKVSSATILLIAYTGKNLRYFHVRKNAILLKCEWPKNPEWSQEFYQWLCKNSRTFDDMEREVSQIFGFRWYALNDRQYKLTQLNLTIPYYYEGFEEEEEAT